MANHAYHHPLLLHHTAIHLAADLLVAQYTQKLEAAHLDVEKFPAFAQL
jgi:hypothetical protein